MRLARPTEWPGGSQERAGRRKAMEEAIRSRGWTALDPVYEEGRKMKRRGNALGRVVRGEADVLVLESLAGACRDISDMVKFLARVHDARAYVVCLDPELDLRPMAETAHGLVMTFAEALRPHRLATRRYKAEAKARIAANWDRRREEKAHVIERVERFYKSGMSADAIAQSLTESKTPRLNGSRVPWTRDAVFYLVSKHLTPDRNYRKGRAAEFRSRYKVSKTERESMSVDEAIRLLLP